MKVIIFLINVTVFTTVSRYSLGKRNEEDRHATVRLHHLEYQKLIYHNMS